MLCFGCRVFGVCVLEVGFKDGALDLRFWTQASGCGDTQDDYT